MRASLARVDPRWFQIGSLLLLLGANIAWFDFGARPVQTLVTLAAAIGVQWLACRALTLWFDPLSPLITGLSLSLLLRTNDPALWVAAPAIAIGSKMLLRIRGKHVFNPANIGIVALIAAGADVWVSPGQWGATGWLAALLLSLGALVLGRARRADTAAVFIAAYAGLLFLRAARLGDPAAIPLHQLMSGSLLLFTCFMITDPRSTPDHPAGRALFAIAVAALAYHLQFDRQVRPGLFLALAAVSVTTPLIDAAFRAARYRWPAPTMIQEA